MIETKTVVLITPPGPLPGSSPERAAFPIEVIFSTGEGFAVELTVGEGPELDSYPVDTWWLDPLWAGRQPWLGEAADE
jgi:hypothetical protein